LQFSEEPLIDGLGRKERVTKNQQQKKNTQKNMDSQVGCGEANITLDGDKRFLLQSPGFPEKPGPEEL
jgi:hypothetical protein